MSSFHCFWVHGVKGITDHHLKHDLAQNSSCVVISQKVAEFYTSSKFGHQKATAEQCCMKAREYYRIYSYEQYKIHRPLGVPKTLLTVALPSAGLLSL